MGALGGPRDIAVEVPDQQISHMLRPIRPSWRARIRARTHLSRQS